MEIVTQMLEIFTEVTTGLMELVISLFTSAVSIFWVTTGENAGPTFLGVVVLIVVSVPLIYFAINWVLSLIRKIRLSKK